MAYIGSRQYYAAISLSHFSLSPRIETMLGGLVGDKSFIEFTLDDVSFVVILHPWAVAAF